jgi:anti-sigma factor RsiW
MSCSPFDLNDYFLQELPDPQQRLVETHVKTCGPCREELDRLRIMGAALRSIPEEEIPQRIAFVSDKIFEPSPWRRWLAAFWNSGARLGFVSAAMLSASLLVLALHPAPSPVTIVRSVSAPAPASSTQAALIAPVSETEIQQRIQVAVEKAVDAKTGDLAKQLDSARRQLLIVADSIEYDQRRARTRNVSAMNLVLPEADRDADAKKDEVKK